MARHFPRTFPLDSLGVFEKFSKSHVFHRLPEHYKKQLKEQLDTKPTPVHWIPDPRSWYKHPVTYKKTPVQNVPYPVRFPLKSHQGLWGGEGILKGFKVGRGKSMMFQFPWFRIPHFWVPSLQKSILYSEILDKYMSTVVTERTLTLIDQYHGLDNYILKSTLTDLQSRLGFNLRRMMLTALVKKDMYHNDPEKQAEVYEKYKQFIVPEEEIEWIGLTIQEAISKQLAIEKADLRNEKPLKYRYRKELIEKLIAMDSEETEKFVEQSKESWLNKFLPFTSTKKETTKPLK